MALFSLRIRASAEQAQELSWELMEAGAGAVEERPGPKGVELVIWGEDEEALCSLQRLAESRVGAHGCSLRREGSDKVWESSWANGRGATALCSNFWVVPLGATVPETGEHLLIEPALAFGIGEHATTRICAEALLEQLRPDDSVLDVGCGTGVLALLAARLGAKRVLGIDNSAKAVAAARRNVELNGLAVQIEDTPLGEVGADFSLVVANLETPVLLELAAELARVGSGARSLLISGMLEPADEGVQARFADLGFRRLERVVVDDWVLLRLCSPGRSPLHRARKLAH